MSDQQLTDYSGIETVESFFLPSFCDVRMVFAVVVIAQLLAFIITLVSPGVMQDAWGNLGLISLFMQWIALTSAAMLCVCRPMLARMGNRVAAVVSYLLVLLVTAVVSELAFWLMLASTVFPEISVDQHAAFLLRNLTISYRDCRHRAALFVCAVPVAPAVKGRGAGTHPGVAGADPAALSV